MGHAIPSWVLNSYKVIGVFGFGAASSQLTTDIAKYTIGRLRPHFISVCVPNVNCTLPENQHKYWENFECTSDAGARKLKEARYVLFLEHCHIFKISIGCNFYYLLFFCQAIVSIGPFLILCLHNVVSCCKSSGSLATSGLT